MALKSTHLGLCCIPTEIKLRWDSLSFCLPSLVKGGGVPFMPVLFPFANIVLSHKVNFLFPPLIWVNKKSLGKPRSLDLCHAHPSACPCEGSVVPPLSICQLFHINRAPGAWISEAAGSDLWSDLTVMPGKTEQTLAQFICGSNPKVPEK